MRILFDDLVRSATLSSTYESANYPAQNLAHVFVKKRYQATASPDTVTIAWAADQAINCIFYGFHNVTGLVFTLKASGGSTLKTVTVSDPDEYGAEYFSVVSGVRSVSIAVTGAAGMYVGKVSMGEYYQAPDPDDGFDEPLTDNTSVVRSPGGQTLATRSVPLLGLSVVFSGKTRSEWVEFRDLYRSISKGATIWVDFSEDDHSFMAPLYCAFNDSPKREKIAGQYSWTAELMESR